MKLRVVADTTTVISGLLWRGVPFAMLLAARDRYELLTTNELLAELDRTLRRPKFDRRVAWAGQTVAELVEELSSLVQIVTPSQTVVEIRDPDDLKVLQAAIGGRADLIVTNDTDLLVLGSVEGVGIVRPVDLLHTLGVHLAD